MDWYFSLVALGMAMAAFAEVELKNKKLEKRMKALEDQINEADSNIEGEI